jgi:hypothetical protein
MPCSLCAFKKEHNSQTYTEYHKRSLLCDSMAISPENAALEEKVQGIKSSMDTA